MSVPEWVSMLSAIAAVLATTFAGVELHRGGRDRRAEADAQRNGVAVTWRPIVRPNHAEASGTATWVYEITVQNPGPLPVRDVVVTFTFTTDVRRQHYDDTIDPPTRSLTLRQPVVLGNGTRTWKRHLVLPFDAREHLEDTKAVVTFTPVDGPRQTNHMDGTQPTVHRAA